MHPDKPYLIFKANSVVLKGLVDMLKGTGYINHLKISKFTMSAWEVPKSRQSCVYVCVCGGGPLLDPCSKALGCSAPTVQLQSKGHLP